MPYKKLVEGFYHFQKDYFKSEKKLQYQELVEEGQKPETLVIACSDSRIDPAILTNSDPGEFFAIRNVAALVPPYKSTSVLRGTSSAIEYAVRFLEVKHIVILGHSGCGGINALATGNYQVGNNHNFQFLNRWLGIGEKAKEEVFKKFHCSHEEEKIRILEQATILTSMENLLCFPWIKDKCDREELQIHGWYFDMITGELLEYNTEQKAFEKINYSDTPPVFLREAPDLSAFLENYTKNCACSSQS